MAEVTLRPDAAGDQTDIPNQEPNSGAHWDKVDEAVSDDDTTYVYSSTSATAVNDLYNLPSLPVGFGSISSITVWARCKKSNASFPLANFTILMKTGGTTYTSAAQSLADTWGNFSTGWATNPQTEVAWTVTDINALQIGVRINGTTAPPTQFTSCTQVWVVVSEASSGFIPKIFYF